MVESLISKDLFQSKDFDFIKRMMVENPRWVDYITTTLTDDHTCPISNMIPSFISPYQINWIPLDHPEFNSNFFVKSFLSENIIFQLKSKRIEYYINQKLKQKRCKRF